MGKVATIHIGEQTATWNLQQLSQDQLFLAIATDDLRAGCSIQAVIDNGRDGSSKPFTLAHIVRMPQVDSFTVVKFNEGLRRHRRAQITSISSPARIWR